jgi:vitamin B12 transporter
MTNMKKLLALYLFLNIAFLFPSDGFSAQVQTDVEKEFLALYFTEDELMVESPTRGRKSVAQTAENVTVVTAEEIKRMNAHTLTDVLYSVPGLELIMSGGPGSAAMAGYVQALDNKYVTVFRDGAPLNNLAANITEFSSIPVQNIEKVEIVRGPASSSWGSALGGVINIITKSGSGDPAGEAYASYGERRTGDFRASASGKGSRLGYYLDAGRLQSDGFRPHNEISGDNAYAKLSYDITKDVSAAFTAGYSRLARGIAELPFWGYYETNTMKTLDSTFTLSAVLDKETVMTFSAWQMRQHSDFYDYQLGSGIELVAQEQNNEDKGFGSSARLTWKHGPHNLVVGADYETKALNGSYLSEEQVMRKQAVYLNDTLSFGGLFVTPGARYDRTNKNRDFTSPSLGITYKLTDAVLLRGYAARGFSIPLITSTVGAINMRQPNPDLRMETVWAYEAGVETTFIPGVWLKLSGFRYDVSDVITRDIAVSPPKDVNSGKQRRQGAEIELKTAPVYHTSFSAAATFIRSDDLDAGEAMQDLPQRTYDLGLEYDDGGSFSALLKGRYLSLNLAAMPPPLDAIGGKFDDFIVDFHATKRLCSGAGRDLDAFFDVHNIFNGAQYIYSMYKNPDRWLEAGIRYSF